MWTTTTMSSRWSGLRPHGSNFTVSLRVVCVLDAVELDPGGASKLLWCVNHMSQLRRTEFIFNLNFKALNSPFSLLLLFL